MKQGFAVVRLTELGWEVENYFFGSSARLDAESRAAVLNVSANALEWGVFSARQSGGRTGLWWEVEAKERVSDAAGFAQWYIAAPLQERGLHVERDGADVIAEMNGQRYRVTVTADPPIPA